MTELRKNKENVAMDVCKFVCCILIAISHLPSVFPTKEITYYYNGWYFRFCVPFFFLCTGYFFSKTRNKVAYLRRIGWVVALGFVLYLPAIFEGVTDVSTAVREFVLELLLGYKHLWYLHALLVGLLIWLGMEKFPLVSRHLLGWGGGICAVLLLMLGAVLDEYYPFLHSSGLERAVQLLKPIDGSRNAVFFGFPLLILGGIIARKEKKLRRIPTAALLLLWVLTRGAGLLEYTFLRAQLPYYLTTDVTFFGWMPGVVLLMLSLRWELPLPEQLGKGLRRISEYVYILHPMMAVWIGEYVQLPPVVLLVSTIVLCISVYLLLEKQFVLKK